MSCRMGKGSKRGRRLVHIRQLKPMALTMRGCCYLASARKRGVLRQAGAVCQSRHVELQHGLATRDANEQQADAPAA